MNAAQCRDRKYDIVIVGGLGHVGLPLGLVFAQKAKSVCLFDIDPAKAQMVKDGKMPFIEYGAEGVFAGETDSRLRQQCQR